MINILWVEDQFHWIDKFKPILEQADFIGAGPGGDDDALLSVKNTVQVFKFSEAACQYINQASEAPDIAILDANMNGNDEAGFTVSRALNKKWPEVAVIYLSEHSGTGIEQKAFEETGAQDFIAKHQQNIEAVLCWRIKAIIRQRTLSQPNPANSSSGYGSSGYSNPGNATAGLITSGGLSIDTSNWNVYWHGERLMNPTNQKRPLPPTPRKILRYLVEASPQPLTTFQIAEKLGADLEKFSYANYRQHIRTLRQSIEQAATAKKLPSFIDSCKSGTGITTFGDDGAYCWINE
jgi:DNA-binding response OmpR family regulator